MVTLSDEQVTRSRKNEAIILKCLASAGQRIVADKLSVDESSVSRMKSDGVIERFSQLLAIVGLKVVDENYRCIDHKTLEAILHGHRMWVASIESHEQLTWD